ncbi:MAG: ATP-grasp domain-containing protein, partial [Candidatus Helarchaeota archaeon]
YEVNHERELFEISKKIISEIKGLNGYVGIDYVINENGIYFMEINPRITTSYIGIQNTLNQNMAKYLINLDQLNELSNDKLEHKGVSYFSKIYKDIKSIEKLERFIKYDTFVYQLMSPPFKVSEESETCCAIVATVGKDHKEARKMFEEKRIKFNKLINF